MSSKNRKKHQSLFFVALDSLPHAHRFLNLLFDSFSCKQSKQKNMENKTVFVVMLPNVLLRYKFPTLIKKKTSIFEKI